MQWLAIVTLSVLLCITYGVIHDQITARICVEYFTIGHPRILPTEDPTVLGVVWGVLATWWVGAILGALLATAARIGHRPQRKVRSLLLPMGILVGCSATLALLAGAAAYIAASMGWISLIGRMAERVPQDKHTPFLVDLWAHTASYLGALVGGLLLIRWVWQSRREETPAA